MKVFSHYDEVHFQVGVNVIGIPEYITHKVARYNEVRTALFVKNERIPNKVFVRKVQKCSSSRPKFKKDNNNI